MNNGTINRIDYLGAACIEYQDKVNYDEMGWGDVFLAGVLGMAETYKTIKKKLTYAENETVNATVDTIDFGFDAANTHFYDTPTLPKELRSDYANFVVQNHYFPSLEDSANTGFSAFTLGTDKFAEDTYKYYKGEISDQEWGCESATWGGRLFLVAGGLSKGTPVARKLSKNFRKNAVRSAKNAAKRVRCQNKKPRYRGGPHSETKKPVGDGLDSHHMPADSINPLGREDGTAIQMEPQDHRLTSSYGNSREAQAYRGEILDRINSGDMRGAMAKEIRDVRRAAREASGDGSKYNNAIREMLDYAKGAGIL